MRRTALLIAALLAVLFGSAIAHGQHRLNIINAESGLSRAELTREVRRSIRTMRRGVRKRYRIARYSEVEDDSWPLTGWARLYYMWTVHPLRLNHTTMVFYNARNERGYGIAQVCRRHPFAMVAYEDYPNFLKFVISHELGHTLGAKHDWQSDPHTLMYPFWTDFLDGPRQYRFSEYSLAEMKSCKRLTQAGGWEF